MRDVIRPGYIWDEEYFKINGICCYTNKKCELINYCHQCEVSIS